MDSGLSGHPGPRYRRAASAGLFKAERVIDSPQEASIRVATGTGRGHQPLRQQLSGPGQPPGADQGRAQALDRYGYGMASVRFICGTQTVHKELEDRISASSAPRTRSSIPPASTPTAACSRPSSATEDAVISDALNHASIIDGIRLCKAQRLRYATTTWTIWRAGCRRRRLPRPADRHRRRVLHGRHHRRPDGICDLAEAPRRLVMIDDCHATGFLGDSGRGTHEYSRRRSAGRHHHRHPGQGPGWRVRWLSPPAARRSSPGCASVRGPICSPTPWRRSSPPPRSRCWTCSRTAPRCASAVGQHRYFREQMTALGFDLLPGEHPSSR